MHEIGLHRSSGSAAAFGLVMPAESMGAPFRSSAARTAGKPDRGWSCAVRAPKSAGIRGDAAEIAVANVACTPWRGASREAISDDKSGEVLRGFEGRAGVRSAAVHDHFATGKPAPAAARTERAGFGGAGAALAEASRHVETAQSRTAIEAR